MSDFYDVSSYNQNGGITAGQVYIGNQKRKLNEEMKIQLSSNLSNKNLPVSVTSVLGDSEAYNFALEIKGYLKSQGYTTNGINMALFDKPIKGNNLHKKEDSYDIVIGTMN